MTYLGAYRLKTDEAERGQKMLQHREAYFPVTTKTREVVDVDGWEKNFRITGENLHGNNNNCYWPKLRMPLQAHVSTSEGDKQEFTISLTGKSTHIDDEDERNAEYVKAKLVDMKCKGFQPIGDLGIYCMEDYELAPELPLAIQGYMIDIGRYGPWSNKGTCFYLCSCFYE